MTLDQKGRCTADLLLMFARNLPGDQPKNDEIAVKCRLRVSGFSPIPQLIRPVPLMPLSKGIIHCYIILTEYAVFLDEGLRRGGV
jgi:hypothetical protein